MSNPAASRWWQVRLEHLLEFRPQEIESMFLTNKTMLYRDLTRAADQAKAYYQTLKTKGLPEDQIDELVAYHIAPTSEVTPEERLPEEVETKIRDWAENPENPITESNLPM